MATRCKGVRSKSLTLAWYTVLANVFQVLQTEVVACSLPHNIIMRLIP